ncbi:MAG: hypothetical protein ACW9W9_04965 [Candidatus Nitrosopumilus sp. Bin_571-38]
MVKKIFHEIKAGNSSHSTKEREFRDENPRKYKTTYVDGDNPLHNAKEIGRKAKKFWNEL